MLTLIREVAVFRERMWSNGNIRPLRQPRADTGFSPCPQPVLVGTHKTMGEAWLSKPLDRTAQLTKLETRPFLVGGEPGRSTSKNSADIADK